MAAFHCLLSISVGTQTMFPNGFTADRHDGLNNCSGTTLAVKDASVSMLDAITLALCTSLPQNETGDNAILHDNSPPLEETLAVTLRNSHREGFSF